MRKRTSGSDGARENKIKISPKENKRNASNSIFRGQINISYGSRCLALLCAAVVAQGRGKVASTWAAKLKCNVHSFVSHSTHAVISASHHNQMHELGKQLSTK